VTERQKAFLNFQLLFERSRMYSKAKAREKNVNAGKGGSPNFCILTAAFVGKVRRNFAKFLCRENDKFCENRPNVLIFAKIVTKIIEIFAKTSFDNLRFLLSKNIFANFFAKTALFRENLSVTSCNSSLSCQVQQSVTSLG
jgi:hypothetical protein